MRSNELEFLSSVMTPLVLECGASPPQWGSEMRWTSTLASRRNRDHAGESQIRHAEAMTSGRMWNQIICRLGDAVLVNRWSVDCLPETAHASASSSTSTRSANRAGCSSLKNSTCYQTGALSIIIEMSNLIGTDCIQRPKLIIFMVN